MVKKKPTTLTGRNLHLIQRLAWLFGRNTTDTVPDTYKILKYRLFWSDFVSPDFYDSQEFKVQYPALPGLFIDPEDKTKEHINLRFLGFPSRQLMWHRTWRSSKFWFAFNPFYYRPFAHARIEGKLGHVFYQPRELERTYLSTGVRDKRMPYYMAYRRVIGLFRKRKRWLIQKFYYYSRRRSKNAFPFYRQQYNYLLNWSIGHFSRIFVAGASKFIFKPPVYKRIQRQVFKLLRRKRTLSRVLAAFQARCFNTFGLFERAFFFVFWLIDSIIVSLIFIKLLLIRIFLTSHS